MIRRYSHISIHTLLMSMLLVACNSNDALTDGSAPTHENGAIELSAGIVDGGATVTTRAGAEYGEHNTHGVLTKNTKLALRVSGTWTGHDGVGSTTPGEIIYNTTANVDNETATDSKHNAITCDPTLYWDNYGTADPNNATTGRTTGLTIYGVAIDGKTDAAPSVSNWTSLDWTLSNDQTQTTETPAKKDLLISNNVQASTAQTGYELNTGNYKFAEIGHKKLLEFRHALSKITVYLKAGDGFTGGNFESTPDVWLTSNTPTTSNAEWAKISGKVNITDGTLSEQSNPQKITMCTSGTAPTGYQVSKEALVFPGSQFTSDDAIIAKINADGNIYYVKALEIRKAIDSDSHDTDGAYSLESGKNYVLKIRVNKTNIVVTATVTNWVNVEAAQEAPVINVSASFGEGTTAATNAFSFYRSTSMDTGYGEAAVGNYYPQNASVAASTWAMTPQLYWPTHDTHYQFRGVWPATGTETGEQTYPRVENGSGNTSGCQVIKVKNVAYSSGTFPSDLMIARPEVADATCNNSDHTAKNLWSDGICATEGTIKLNFRYMMSQVEVNLTTSDAGASDKVELEGAKVEIVNVHKTGDVKLGTREVVTTGVATSPTPVPTTDTFGDYEMTGYTYDSGTKKGHCRHAIVPQPLTFTSAQAAGNLKFRITITNNNGTPGDTSDDTQDVYYADIKPINVKEEGSSNPAAPVTAWESGKHYVYNLLIKKTAIKVEATLTDWKTVNASSQDVWF